MNVSVEMATGFKRNKARVLLDPDRFKRIGDAEVTRADVERELGEEAALAWEDVQAARRSYWRAVERYLERRRV
jgi:hypothetical protein